ncbi:ATPase family AAA domain-containing protein 1 [Aplysia californica]|uniref:ATPase family AAA domain-containing protein 1 n=1 Tax=Aplysia californica TaxID=6500 RepID=A0ABM1A1V0_APLCA|nr:ATPase family AAA domain-containing protein 1 [Aplysia californica]
MTILDDLSLLRTNLKDISSNVVSEVSRSVRGEPDIVMSEIQNGITRNQVIAKVVSTVLGVAASFTLTYLGIKWLTDAMDPTKKEKKLAQAEAQRMLSKLGVQNVGKLSDYELCVAANLLDPHSMEVTWGKIGGLENIIQEIQETVILPFQRADLFRNSSLLQPPKGILLHGPPGCGKTMIAKATAKAAGARFINLQVSTLVDKWYGESQKRAEAVFSLAIKLQPTIIFIDEIDSFLRSRSSTDHEATAMMKTQFMSLWDGLTTDPNLRVMIMGATNRPQDVDAAILRRMPSQFYVGMPDSSQRESILQLILQQEDTEELNYSQLSQLGEGLSGSDLREACRSAAVAVVHEYVQAHSRELEPTGNGDAEELRRMTMADLQTAIHKVKSTKALSARPLAFPLD